MLVALVAHLVEIAAWALVFVLCREFPDYPSTFCHSAVNYTTLGYGDVITSPSWRLLGPLEAADGSLIFGVSTGMIFAVILRLIQTRWRNWAVSRCCSRFPRGTAWRAVPPSFIGRIIARRRGRYWKRAKTHSITFRVSFASCAMIMCPGT
ncbi:MAG: ion channel [Candidatus Binataceae bacterium]